jgi:2'-5' RNA ligase
MSGFTDSAVIVTVPPAEAAVAPYRALFDRAAALGVPAHVTVLYPFVPPSEIDTRVTDTLAVAVVSVPRFDAVWAATGWFGSDVLWLDPQPADQFRALTTAVSSAFPDYPPYGGEYDDVKPHLTVGEGAAAEDLREVEAQLRPHLPIRMTVASVSLWCGADSAASWRQVAAFLLG